MTLEIENNPQSAREIFRQGSSTFSTAAEVFPRELRDDVTTFYAFVRIADNFVDQDIPNINGFNQFRDMTDQAFAGLETTNPHINAFSKLSKEKDIPKQWVDDFLDTMESDTQVKEYRTYDDLLKYIYGSAEVIGLFMTKIIGLPDSNQKPAMMMGRSFQIANIIRDVAEDYKLGRIYIPKDELNAYGLTNILPSNNAEDNQFRALMRMQIDRYRETTEIAREGLGLLPYRIRLAVKTSSDMYDWTMDQINREPLIIFEKKVKPSKIHIGTKGVVNAFNF